MKLSLVFTLISLFVFSSVTWSRDYPLPHERGERGVRNPRNPRRPVVDRPRNPRNPRRPVVDRPHNPRNPRNPRRPVVNRPNRRPHLPHEVRRYRQYRHRRYVQRYRHSTRYYSPYDYYNTVPRRYFYNNTWLRFYVGYSYVDGYIQFAGYPYFVYNGYRHRYSAYDNCNYDLVDGYNNRIEARFYGMSCMDSYDRCAELRDDYNWYDEDYRYFCSETNRY